MSKNSEDRLNNFVIKLANVNGTGSASANSLLMKSIFRMGIPVTAKNYFPSNIQGLPTWYEIRVSGDGFLARAGRIDIMVAMNAQTYQQDLKQLDAGGYLIYDSSWPREKEFKRDDVHVIGVPLAKLCNENFSSPRARILMKNMVYVGVLAALIGIEDGVINEMIEEMFATKAKLIPANKMAISLGKDYVLKEFNCPLDTRLERLDKTAGHILIDGNTASGLGCVYAGATVAAWYPITPSTTVMDSFKSFCNQFRTDPDTGKKNYCIIQAEDELAAIGMVLGASWNGARAFTSTSGPGVSLMSEFLGLGYFGEIPAVLIDVQRVGPSTGMPTRTQQSDIMPAAFASHGDTKHVLLFPANPNECFDMAINAFDLADRLQTPVIVLQDLDVGMNDWMCKEFKWDETYVPDRGKVLNKEELEEAAAFYRYLDVDGDGIAARSYPGVHKKGAYFLRGSGHNKFGVYTENSDEYQEVLDRLLIKWETAKTLVPKPAIKMSKKKTKVGLISSGGCDYAVLEALDRLEKKDIYIDYLRVKAFPFTKEVEIFLEAYDQVYVVEQNRDAQLKSLLLIETDYPKDQLISILDYGGMPLAARTVVSFIEKALVKGAVA
jgi:2-oxoglutarate ferredoxin oxidoreductase subunit alpha